MSSSKQGTDWDEWRVKIFGDPYLVWHDGPDFAGLRRVTRSDPDTADRMLRAGLLAEDPLAAQSMRFLASEGLAPGGAADALRAAATTASAGFLIRVAQALYALTGDAGWAEPVASVLVGEESEFVRLDAAIALADFPPSAELVAALRQAVTDPHYLVRYHSANTLLRYACDTRRIERHRDVFRRIAKSSGEDGADAAGDPRPGWHSAAEEFGRPGAADSLTGRQQPVGAGLSPPQPTGTDQPGVAVVSVQDDAGTAV